MLFFSLSLSLSLKKLSEKTFFFFCARVRVYKNVPSFSLIPKKPEWTKKVMSKQQTENKQKVEDKKGQRKLFFSRTLSLFFPPVVFNYSSLLYFTVPHYSHLLRFQFLLTLNRGEWVLENLCHQHCAY